jgi:DNA-nicking Smr family endonuclease
MVGRREVKGTSDIAGPRGDRGLWQKAVRDVRPLRGARPTNIATESPCEADAAAASARVERGRTTAPGIPLPPLDGFAGIDRANAERLKRGLHRIDARLDLHGMTQAEAHGALSAFIASSRVAGRRCVLVITGRGFGQSGPGVLKSSVPRWLEEPELRRHILAIAPAQPQHGGPGATYLLLRRR